MTRKQIEAAGNKAVKILRREKIKNGKPFMINTYDLPTDQCYLEYANDRIELVKLSADKTDFIVIRRLTLRQIQALRKKYGLSKL